MFFCPRESLAHEGFHIVVQNVVNNLPLFVFKKPIVSWDPSLDLALAAWLPTVELIPNVTCPVFHSIVAVPDQLDLVVSIWECQLEIFIVLSKVVGGSGL